jgi:hypothetical protein
VKSQFSSPKITQNWTQFSITMFPTKFIQSFPVCSLKKNISQLGWLFPIYGKIKHVPNHQPASNCSLIKSTSLIFHDAKSATAPLLKFANCCCPTGRMPTLCGLRRRRRRRQGIAWRQRNGEELRFHMLISSVSVVYWVCPQV